MSEDNRMDETAEQGLDYAKKGAKIAGKPARKAGRTLKKGAKKLGKKLALGAMRALAMFIAWAWPVLLVAFGVVFIAWAVNEMAFESKGQNQEYQDEEYAEQNTYGKEVDENGRYLLESVSDGNRLVNIFYGQFGDKSYYVLEGDSETLHRADEQYIKDKQIYDKYNREKSFMLSETFLLVMDTYLNKGEIKTPETWIQPVAWEHDKEKNLKLKDLTDKDGEVAVKSQKYTKNGARDGSNKTEGVWDYGFAPVFHYEEYKELSEYRGNITQDQEWNPETERVEPVDSSELGKAIAPENKTSKTVWLMDELVHPAGTLSYKDNIEYEWRQTNDKWSRTESRNETVKVKRIEYVQKDNDDGQLEFYQPRYVWRRQNDWPTWFDWDNLEYDRDGNPKLPYVPPLTISGSAKPSYDGYTYIQIQDGWTNRLVTEDQLPKGSERLYPFEWRFDGNYDDKDITLTRVIDGYRWEKVPKIVGQPKEDLIGTDYFKDYFQAYENYIPEDVMTTFDIKERLKKSDKEIKELLEKLDSDTDTAGPDGNVQVTDLKLGGNASSQTYEKAVENIAYFKKYGEMFGVDPYILVAKAAQESGGSHTYEDGSVKYAGPGAGAIGIMQIEHLSGSPARSVTAYNFQTKQEETFTATPEQLKDIDTNIKWGAMYIASLMPRANYNMLVALQAYNYGDGFISYAKEKGGGQWTQQLALDAQLHFSTNMNRNDRSHQIMRNDPKNPLGPANYGDAYYLEHVLRYYASPDSKLPWILDKSGNKVAMDNSSFEFGSVGAVNGGTLLSSVSNNLSARFRSVFSLALSNFKTDINTLLGFEKYEAWQSDTRRVKFSPTIDDEDAEMIIHQIFAFEEKRPLSDYKGMTEEEFKERFMLLFTHSGGKSLVEEKQNTGVVSSDFFPDGYVEPVKDAQVITKFGYVTGKEKDEEATFHGGIDIKVAPAEYVKSVAAGTVTSVSGSQIVIDHGRSVTTTYSYLNKVMVKNGDKVKKGQAIGQGSKDSDTEGAFHFALRRNLTTEDPTWIVDPSLLANATPGGIVIDPSAKGHFQSPFPDGKYTITDRHGWRMLEGLPNNHAGTDFVSYAGEGASIHAIADGEITHLTGHSDFGNLVVVNHGPVQGVGDGKTNVIALYAHLTNGSNGHLKVGQKVKKGEAIGKMGNTGLSFGAHLHLQVSIEPRWTASKAVTVDVGLLMPLK